MVRLCGLGGLGIRVLGLRFRAHVRAWGLGFRIRVRIYGSVGFTWGGSQAL